MPQSNVDAARAAYAAFGAGDLQKVAAFMADDTIWHIDHLGGLSGEYKGRDGVLGFLLRLMEETGNTFKTDVHTVVGDESHVAVLLTVSAARKGKSVTAKQAAIYHMRDGQNTEAWFLYDDPAPVNAVFS